MSGTKDDLRAQIVTARRVMSQELRAAASYALCEVVLALPEMSSARCVAAYLSVGTEPATSGLVAALLGRGVDVLVPVLQPDLDLDWARPDESVEPVRTARGLYEPAGARLGPDAITSADLVVVPALAVAINGTRLGRGGGSYDRALARIRATTPRVALLYDGEVLPDVPAEPHDRRVSIAVTPQRVWRFS